jgi:SHS2 domain-containing protein
MAYHFLEHTADIKVKCSAATFTALLESAAEALYAVVLKKRLPTTDQEHVISLGDDTPEEILVRWLQELLFLLETTHFVSNECKWEKYNKGWRVYLKGCLCSPNERDKEVKSVTYHELAVQETAQGFEAQFILDL